MVILIGAGVILIVFGLAAAIAARRRKRVARAREKALKKAGGIDLIVSSCERINKPFSNILRACSILPEGEAFLKSEEIVSSLRELEGAVAAKPAASLKKKKGSRDLSLLDYSPPPPERSSPEAARKSMVRFIRALYMDRGLLQVIKEHHDADLKNAVESLTE